MMDTVYVVQNKRGTCLVYNIHRSGTAVQAHIHSLSYCSAFLSCLNAHPVSGLPYVEEVDGSVFIYCIDVVRT